MKINPFILFLVFFVVMDMYAQDTKKDNKAAKKLIKKGDRLLEKEYLPKYTEALELYLEAHKLDTKNAALNFKLGACYINSLQKSDAVPYFLKALVLDPYIKKETFYLLGLTHH